MSEYITHIAVFEDCARLAIHSGRLCEPFRSALEKNWRLAMMASTTRAGDRHTVRLLQYCREKWPQRRPQELVEEKLAFTLGWLTHQAADRRFKPVYRQLEPEYYARANASDEDSSPSNIRVLHDVVIFREVYDGGRYGPLPAGLLEDRLQGMAAARALDFDLTLAALGSAWQRHLQAAHRAVFAGEFEMVCGRARRRYQRFYVDVQRYASMWADPDPEQMRRFIIEPNFFDARDPLIAMARALRRGERVPAIPFEEAYRRAGRGSQYAQCLQMGLRYLFAANDFFEFRIGEPDLRQRLDLDMTHTQGGRIES